MNDDEVLKIAEAAIIRAFEIPKELIDAQNARTELNAEMRKLFDDAMRKELIRAEEETLFNGNFQGTYYTRARCEDISPKPETQLYPQNYRSAVLDKNGKFVRKID